MSKQKLELSLILPAHNEEEGIEKVLKLSLKILKKIKKPFEIIAVENGSSDNTFKVIKNFIKKHKEIKLIQSKKGWGNAVIRGISKAKGIYTCYMVSDFQVSPIHILKVYKEIKKTNYDLVKVKRMQRENIKRYINSLGFNLLCLFLFGFDQDINATPKILKSVLLKEMKLKSENIALDLELLSKLKKRGLKWKSIPVRSEKRNWGESTTKVKSILEMLKAMYNFKFK